MSGFEVTAPGVDRFAVSVSDAGRALEDLAAVNQQAGAQALAAARIPVDTGRLRDSAYVDADPSGFALSATAPYAGFVHARDPFFTRALDPDDYLDRLETHAADTLGTIQGD